MRSGHTSHKSQKARQLYLHKKGISQKQQNSTSGSNTGEHTRVDTCQSDSRSSEECHAGRRMV